jgi:hypothetical protein
VRERQALISEIIIKPLEEGAFGVEVRGEGATSTHHRVTVPEGMLEELDLAEVDRERLVRESISFLLEREPSTSILPEFSLEEIGGFFPEYFQEIPDRLAP